MSTTIDELLGPHRVIAVVTLDDAGHAADVAGALANGGLPMVEITLRTAAGLSAIAAAATVEGAIVGAGSVLTGDDARAALDAGAAFLVSPGLSPEVLDVAAAAGVPAVPGVATATELMRAAEAGVGTVKLFPAVVSGGTGLVDALSAVFPDVGFIPTGGVTAERVTDYLARPQVRAVGGSWMVPASAVAAGEWISIERAAARAVALGPSRRAADG